MSTPKTLWPHRAALFLGGGSRARVLSDVARVPAHALARAAVGQREERRKSTSTRCADSRSAAAGRITVVLIPARDPALTMQLLSPTDSLFLQRRIQVILAASLVFVALAASVATGYNLWRDRLDSRADQRKAMIEDSATLLTYTESIIERSEHTLRGVEAAVRTSNEASPSDRFVTDELSHALRYESANRYLAFQRGDRIVIVGEAGVVANALAPDALGPRNIALSDGVLLGQPLILAPREDYLYPVALDTADRSGRALRLAALIPRSQLAAVLEQLALSNPNGLGLTLLDGTIWIRYPDFEKFVGARIPSSVSVLQARRGGGVVAGSLAPDQRKATFSITTSRRYPIFSVVAQPDSALDGMLWGRAASQLANLSLLFAILIAASLITRSVVRRLASSESLYRTLFEGVSDSIIVSDTSGLIIGANEQAARLVGRSSRDELVGRSLFSLIYVESADGSVGFEEVRRQFGETPIGQRRSFPIRSAKGAGESIDGLLTFCAVQWRKRRVLVSVIKDVAAEQRYLKQMEVMAHSDPLTGLPSRAALESAVDGLIQSSPRDPFAVLLCDVLRLREVNEAYGHQIGDELICKVGDRLTQALAGRNATIGRHGGGAFIAIVPGLNGSADAQEICKLLRHAVAAPLTIADTNLEVSLSIGVAIYPESGVTAAHLLRRADLTLVRAKEQRLGFLVFEGQDESHSTSPDLTLRTELGHAIREGTLQLAFQPKIRLEDSQVVGAEMLLRWKHPVRGWVPPAEFIPLAETTELIHPLTRWVLEATVKQLRQWQFEGRALAVSVNVSAINLQDPDFVPAVESMLKRSGVDPRDLELEITEGALMQDHEEVAKRLFALHDLGVQLSLDDFGTGFSSLDYVRRFPFNSIKVDKSFVFGMLSREKDRQVVELTLMLAKKLGLKSIAEGVETEEVALALLGMGCDTAQGYLFSAPLLTEDFEKWRREFAEKSDTILRLVPGPRARTATRNPRMRPN